MPNVVPRPQLEAGPSRHAYDVIVFGGQLGGAVAAAVLAKRGYRVLFIEHDGIGPGYEHGGWLLPYAPFVLPGLKASPILEEVLTELSLTTTVQRALVAHQPPLQLVLPRSRIDLTAHDARRTAELNRELGEDGARLGEDLKSAAGQHTASDAYFKEVPSLPPVGWVQSFSARRKIARYPALTADSSLQKSAPAGELVASLAPFLSFRSDPSSPLPQTRALSQVLAGPQHYPGGREGLRHLLYRRLTELGGKVLGSDRGALPVIEGLSFDGRELSGIKVLRSETIFSAACFIAATEAGALRRLVPQRKRQRRLLELLDLSSTKRFAFTVNWVVPAGALPLGMGDLVLVDTQDDQVGPLLIQVLKPFEREALSPSEADKAPAGTRIVCAAALVPASARELGEEHLQGLGERISGHLDRLMPFTRKRVLLESTPFLNASGVRGSRLMPHPLYEVDSEPFLGITGLPAKTPVKNLFLASREVLPGLGTEGEVLAGLQAVRLVQESLKKHRPLHR